MRVKPLIKNANPVPDPAGLSERAAEELAALVGPGGATPAAAPRRSSRRGFVMAAVACGAAVAIGVFSLESDPAVPGAGPHPGVMVDEPSYGSTARLEGAADLIVRARLGAGHEETVDDVPTTLATAKVLATAKGEPAGDAIPVAYTTPGSGPETAGLGAGREYVLLLERGEGGRYFLVNTTQGWYAVEGGAAVAGRGNDVALSPGVRKALRLEAP
ncbi:hypothetical protein [Streptomyces himastatinicus]|nr:hypothetical protein [Streptomyces himastatinicus]